MLPRTGRQGGSPGKGRGSFEDSVSGEEYKTKVEAVDNLNVHLAQVMSRYQREESALCVGHLVILLETVCIAMLSSGGIGSR